MDYQVYETLGVVHLVGEGGAMLGPPAQLGPHFYLTAFVHEVEMQVDIPGDCLLGQHQQVGVGHNPDVLSVDKGVGGAVIEALEGGGHIGGDDLADADVVVGEVGYFGVVVDAEEMGRGAQVLGYAEVIGHQLL